MRILFLLSMLGFISSVIINFLTYLGQNFNGVFILVVSLFGVSIPSMFISNKEDMLNLNVNRVWKIIAILIACYAIAIVSQPKMEIGVVTEENGKFVRQNRGTIIGEVSKSEYIAQELRLTKIASSLTMVGFFLTGLIYLSKSED